MADHLEVGQIHQVQEIGGGDEVDLRLSGPQLQRLGKLQDRLPQMGVVGNHDPRRWPAQLMHQPQRGVDILEHADGIGDHDVVERPLDSGHRRRILDIAQHEMQLGMPGVRLRNGLGAEIDADPVRRLQRGEQIAVPAAKLQHPLARRNQELHEPAVVFVVGGIELAPALELGAVGLEVLEQLALALTGKLQRSGRAGLLQIHCSLEAKNGQFS